LRRSVAAVVPSLCSALLKYQFLQHKRSRASCAGLCQKRRVRCLAAQAAADRCAAVLPLHTRCAQRAVPVTPSWDPQNAPYSSGARKRSQTAVWDRYFSLFWRADFFQKSGGSLEGPRTRPWPGDPDVDSVRRLRQCVPAPLHVEAWASSARLIFVRRLRRPAPLWRRPNLPRSLPDPARWPKIALKYQFLQHKRSRASCAGLCQKRRVRCFAAQAAADRCAAVRPLHIRSAQRAVPVTPSWDAQNAPCSSGA